MDAKPIGAALNRDIGSGAKVEADLNAFIEKRDRQRRRDEGERPAEEAWAESARRHTAKLKAEAGRSRLAWAKHLRRVYAARMDEKDRLIETLAAKLTEPKGGE